MYISTLQNDLPSPPEPAFASLSGTRVNYIGGCLEEPSHAGHLIDAISDCVPTLGTDKFTERFLNVIKLTGAGQATAFAYEPAKVNCLLNQNFLPEDKSRTWAAAYLDGYLDGWFRDDPLFERAMAMKENYCAVERLEDLSSCPAGFRTKVAVLVARGSLRMVLNLYFRGDISHSYDCVKAGVYRLIATALATHDLRLNPLEFPLPFTVLSERERQVCLGMLAGKKAEIIAGEIGVGPSSVVTYRQRAYQKLGISSRGQLFSIYRDHTAPAYGGIQNRLPLGQQI